MSMIGKSVIIKGYSVTVKKKIGEGGYAYVYLTEDNHKRSYALKLVRCQDHLKFNQFIKEAEILSTLPSHPNIVKLYAYKIDRSKMLIYFLFEYAPSTCINILYKRNLTKQEILIIFCAVCKAVRFLHSQNPPIFHRDIKPENLLISSSGHPILCDFGSATTRTYTKIRQDEVDFVSNDILNNTTPNYRSPEMCDLFSKKPIGLPSDIWALGCTLYKLIYKKDLFMPDQNLAILQCRVELPDDIDPLFKRIIRSCVQLDINARPTAEELCSLVLPEPGHRETLEVLVSRAHADRTRSTQSQQLRPFRFFSKAKDFICSYTTSGMEEFVLKATYPSDRSPKMKHCRRILLRARRGDKSNLLEMLLSRPWEKDERVALKVLFCVLLILQYEKDLTPLLHFSTRTDEIYEKYKNSTGSIQKCIVELANCIRFKLIFHSTHTEFEGGFSFSSIKSHHLVDDMCLMIQSLTRSLKIIIGLGRSPLIISAIMPVVNELAKSSYVFKMLNGSVDVIKSASRILKVAATDDYLLYIVSCINGRTSPL